MAFSWLKAPTSTFTFKTLLRHYAKLALVSIVSYCDRENRLWNRWSNVALHSTNLYCPAVEPVTFYAEFA